MVESYTFKNFVPTLNTNQKYKQSNLNEEVENKKFVKESQKKDFLIESLKKNIEKKKDTIAKLERVNQNYEKKAEKV
jgi:hypothetical protein